MPNPIHQVLKSIPVDARVQNLLDLELLLAINLNWGQRWLMSVRCWVHMMRLEEQGMEDQVNLEQGRKFELERGGVVLSYDWVWTKAFEVQFVRGSGGLDVPPQ